MADDTPLTRFFGGSPGRVAFKLVLVSVLVGLVMSALGLNPIRIIDRIERLIGHIFNLGWDAVEAVWSYFLLGAAVVLPIWLVMRLIESRKQP